MSSRSTHNKNGLVVELTILAVQKSITTGHTLSNTVCVDCDCDIQICESDFQRTVNQTVMYRKLFITIRQQIGLDLYKQHDHGMDTSLSGTSNLQDLHDTHFLH